MLPKNYRPGDVINLPTEMGRADGFVPDASLRAQTQVSLVGFSSMCLERTTFLKRQFYCVIVSFISPKSMNPCLYGDY
jgi:hypothetical protein